MKAYNIKELADFIMELGDESNQEEDFIFLMAKVGEHSALVMRGSQKAVVTGMVMGMITEPQFIDACSRALMVHTVHQLTHPNNEEES